MELLNNINVLLAEPLTQFFAVVVVVSVIIGLGITMLQKLLLYQKLNFL